MQISIKTNFPTVQRRVAELQADVADRAMASAVNKTIEQGRTQMIRGITAEYNVTSAYVRERLRIKYASFRSGAFALSAALIGGDGKRRSSNVIAFLEKSTSLAQARKRGKAGTLNQLHFQIKKTGGRRVISGAFIGNKGRTVFKRTGDKRLPIKAISTIDVPQMFNQKRINAGVVAALQARFPEIFEREARFYLSKFGRPA